MEIILELRDIAFILMVPLAIVGIVFIWNIFQIWLVWFQESPKQCIKGTLISLSFFLAVGGLFLWAHDKDCRTQEFRREKWEREGKLKGTIHQNKSE